MVIRVEVRRPDGKGFEVAHIVTAHVMAVASGRVVMANGRTYELRHLDDEDDVVEAVESACGGALDLACEE